MSTTASRAFSNAATFRRVRLRSNVINNNCLSTTFMTRSYASTPSNPEKPKLFGNAAIAAALLAAAGASYWYSNKPVGSSSLASGAKTFTMTSRNGPVTFDFLSPEAIHQRLHENEVAVDLPHLGDDKVTVTSFHNNWVASNPAIEDRHSEDILDRKMLQNLGGFPTTSSVVEDSSSLPQAVEPAAKGIKLFSIMDGHAGDATSTLLSKVLHPMVVLSLRSLYAGHAPPSSFPFNYKPEEESTSGLLSYISWLRSSLSIIPSKPAPINPTTISNSIISAFLTLDHQITTRPLELLQRIPRKQGMPSVRPILDGTIAPAVSGSCAITMLVDEERQELYVANAGDCRAVAGYWVEGKGWRTEVLSEDFMGKNENEVKRMQSEHPVWEKDTVILRGRVNGGLEPTRAFGDCVYKWNHDQYEKVMDAWTGKKRGQSVHCKTPPYVTARPEVVYKSLKPTSKEEGELKFVIMATDGLWDEISSSEAVSLVAGHLQHLKHSGSIPSSTLSSTLLPQTPASSSKYPPPAQQNNNPTASWIFEDTNAATHLIKNSLGGADSTKRNMLLSLTGNYSRGKRDDVTVTVVFFGNPPPVQVVGSAKPIDQAVASGAVKARL